MTGETGKEEGHLSEDAQREKSQHTILRLATSHKNFISFSITMALSPARLEASQGDALEEACSTMAGSAVS